MKRRLGLYLAVPMGFAVMVGYAFQEQPQSLDQDQSYPKAKQKYREILQRYSYSEFAPSMFDQDQGYPKAEQTLREFLQRFPDSDFAPTVRQLLRRAEETVTSGDYKIAQFYADRDNYVGAMSRLRTIIEKYPNFSRIDEAKQLYETLSTADQ
jgi:outer membrane protein assembly factor BamD (BamD/ComL family)